MLRKCTIISRECGFAIEQSDIEAIAAAPAELFEGGIENFYSRVSNSEPLFAAKLEEASLKGGHSESINAQFHENFTIQEIISILHQTPATTIIEYKESPPYPMPLYALDRDHVFIGKIREDLFCPNTINLWVVANNLRNGAATNAV